MWLAAPRRTSPSSWLRQGRPEISHARVGCPTRSLSERFGHRRVPHKNVRNDGPKSPQPRPVLATHLVLLWGRFCEKRPPHKQGPKQYQNIFSRARGPPPHTENWIIVCVRPPKTQKTFSQEAASLFPFFLF